MIIDINVDPIFIIIEIFPRENFEKTSKVFFDLPIEAKNKVRRELSENVFRGYYGSVFTKNVKIALVYHYWDL